MNGLASQRKQKLVGLAIMKTYGGARLQGRGHNAVVDEITFDDIRSRRHRRGNGCAIALLEQECRITRRLRPYKRGVRLQRHGRRGDACERLIGDVHRFASRNRHLQQLRNNADNGIANMPHDATGQRRARRNDDRFDRINNSDARQLPDTFGRKVRLGKHRRYAGNSARSFHTQPGDTREGMGRANHIGVQHAGYVIVGDISPAPGEEAKIFEPVQGLTLITLSQPLTVFPKYQARSGPDTGAAGRSFASRGRGFALFRRNLGKL